MELEQKNYEFIIEDNKTISSKCSVKAIKDVAKTMASFDLRADNQEAFAVYYNGKVQFVLGYKGLVKLAIQTSEYTDLGTTSVKDGESKIELMDKIKVNSKYTFDKNKVINDNDIVGYYAFFELKNGFKKDLFMSVVELEAHAEKYSVSWNKTKRNFGHWPKDRMFEMIVLKQLLTKYGPKDNTMKRIDDTDLKIHDGNNEPQWLDNKRRANEHLEKNKASMELIKNELSQFKVLPDDIRKNIFKDCWDLVFNTEKTMQSLTIDELKMWIKEVKRTAETLGFKIGEKNG